MRHPELKLFSPTTTPKSHFELAQFRFRRNLLTQDAVMSLLAYKAGDVSRVVDGCIFTELPELATWTQRNSDRLSGNAFAMVATTLGSFRGDTSWR